LTDADVVEELGRPASFAKELEKSFSDLKFQKILGEHSLMSNLVTSYFKDNQAFCLEPQLMRQNQR
jgi:hypothetical protein